MIWKSTDAQIPWFHNCAILDKVQNAAFQITLSSPQSDLAQQLVKDPYNLEFLGLGSEISERQLEKALIDRWSAIHLDVQTPNPI